MYHRFWAEGGTGLVGEVSLVIDDSANKRFLEAVRWFPATEDNQEPLHLLVFDYR
ncbi:D-lyxose/D-mannose family sugar isomerase [Sphaerochaeta halotolerans]|jgi:hypothetical protein|uniref:D-lyxose/D-mannose family sugar isomerase n=1 Tax=Sphaerochaeta halotolerans TaxID=2293840 RepID=UPI003B018350